MGPSLPSTTRTALRQLGAATAELSRSTGRLATGRRISRGGDDPAGLVSADRLRAALSALEAESTALQRTDRVAATADRSLGAVSDQLAEANGLAVRLANDGGISDAERAAVQGEIDSILSAVSRTANATGFAGNRLLDGSATLQASGDTLTLPNVAAGSLGETQIDGVTYHLSDIGSTGALAGDPAAQQQVVRAAISDVASARGRIGSFQKHTVGARRNVVSTAIAQAATAESSIRDTDFALETARLARARIVATAAAKAVSIANDNQKSVLSLLG